MNLSLSAFCVWALLIASSCEGRTPCTAANDVFVCTTIPNASFYPPNLKHLVFVVLSGFESINNTMLSSLNLNSVTNLTVSNSDIASIEQGAFDSFLQLTGLNLNGNKLSNINAAWFFDAAGLISLSLSRNRIQAIGVDTLSRFSNLVELYLSQNKINTIADQSLRGNLKLSILDLSSNKLVFLTEQALAGPNLQRISLHTNPWSCLCEHADWMSFLRDLNNNSVLVQGCSVTCNDPPNLKGIPVWNASDFACAVTTSTTWSDQHTEPHKLHPMLLGLLGMLKQIFVVQVFLWLLFLLLLFLFLFLLVKRKQEKEQVKPDGQETNQQEKHPQRESAKENFSKDHQSAPHAGVEVINSESCAAVRKKRDEFAPVTMSGAQQDGEHAQLTKVRISSEFQISKQSNSIGQAVL
ncbi:SLIT and NTRK-like protein 2 [Rhincodon typus]|uniref:SLIT and NTRK-like protein 2 n=1 Tax=Rhincodon typus TaxID=259920 RepID=UPI00202EF651|nr:SLIT and NTRK-like protein 2 [Rhincodon typus]